MLTLAVLAIMTFVVLPALAWVIGMVFRVFGWTMRMVFGVLLMPLWIVLALVGGLAFAAQAIVPIALVVFLVSMLVPES
ncbi:MAG: hypothetical protein IJ203_12950 [Atopobiaceae bacterium]|nr:hypothetical protein [Atopobiaceae bacterium]